MIVFEVDDYFMLTTAVPKYTILSLIERFGGLACVIFFVAKYFVSIIES